MASFDFVDAAAKGYEFSWRERGYFARAMIPVLFVKLACVIVVRFLHIGDQNLLSGLVEMPAYVVEALFMISVVRFVAFQEPLFEFGRVLRRDEVHKKLNGEGPVFSDVEIFKASVALYLLIKIVQTAFVGVMLDYGPDIEQEVDISAPEQNLSNAIIFVVLFGALLWSVRLIWLYIPVAMGFTIKSFLVRARGVMSSLNIFAIWFVTYFPLVIFIAAIFMLSNFVLLPESMLQIFVHDLIRVCGEMLIILVQAVAITFGFIEVLTGRKSKI